MIAFFPSIRGLAGVGVRARESLPPVLISHAQPDPKRPTPAALNCSRNFAKSPNAVLIAAPSFPPGSPPALGAIICQNMEWFQCPPPLLRIGVRTASGSVLTFRIR